MTVRWISLALSLSMRCVSFVALFVCLSEVEKTRKRNSSRQEIRKGVTTCLHLYIPKVFPSYDHVRWRKHLNDQPQQHGEISPFSSVNRQTLPGKRPGGGGGNRVVREKIANGTYGLVCSSTQWSFPITRIKTAAHHNKGGKTRRAENVARKY